MKRLIILSTICTVLLGCSITESPQFIGIENIKVLTSTSKHITFTADALFKNPNAIEGTLKTDAIKVFVNDNEVATVSSERFNVPAKKDFSIPLKTNVPTDSLYSNKNLSGLLGSIFSKKIKIQYKGDIKYTVFGFSHTYSINKTENVNIKF
ncbi:LEA type 2 family protein [Mariniflexile ostreae]|uniref:LEA type 2 family protein n=1 Tax=Mariniflexile ostreae TaxID=1520892 RepID=A0ABV5FEP7_9FLAO